MTPTKSSLRS